MNLTQGNETPLNKNLTETSKIRGATFVQLIYKFRSYVSCKIHKSWVLMSPALVFSKHMSVRSEPYTLRFRLHNNQTYKTWTWSEYALDPARNDTFSWRDLRKNW
jgi:hypothetical protein